MATQLIERLFRRISPKNNFNMPGQEVMFDGNIRSFVVIGIRNAFISQRDPMSRPSDIGRKYGYSVWHGCFIPPSDRSRQGSPYPCSTMFRRSVEDTNARRYWIEVRITRFSAGRACSHET